MSRITAVRRLLDEREADGVIVTFMPHVRWISDFTGSSALVYLDRARACLITDGRYRDQAEAEVSNFDVLIAESNLIDFLGGMRWNTGGQTILTQGEHISFSDMQRLRTALTGAVIQALDGFLSPLVAVKDTSEIESIRSAQAITEEVFLDLLEWIEPGITEQDVAAEIICRHLRSGAEGMSFDPIVASGPNGALPHVRPGHRRLENGDLVVLDFGCVWKGYASDMTRTIALGDPEPDASAAYEIVLQAQADAIDAARSGMHARDLDRVAREHISKAGLGDFFTHSLGHGVGLQVHEWPRVSASSDHLLPAGVVISIEPGVYVPGQFGVRIEDLVVLQSDGCMNLTTAPKHLIVV